MRFVYLFLFSKSFISLPPPFFNSYIRFVYLFLSFRTVHFVILFSFSFYSLTCASFTSSFPLRALISSRPSFRCNSTLRFVTSFLSFQLFSMRFVTFSPFVSTLRFCSLYLVPFVLNSPLPFVTFFPSFQRFHPVHCHLPLSFISRRSFRYFHSFCFNVSTQFVYLFLSFQAVHFVTCFFIFLSLQLFLSVRFAFPFLSTRPFHIPLTISTTKRVNTCLIPFPVSWKIHAQKMKSCTGFCSKRAFAASGSGVSFST